MLNRLEFNRIVAQLKNLGCTETEASIYLKALQIGPSTIQEISHQLNIHRVTVYSAVEHLVQKGILYETRKEKKRLVVAEKPDIFHSIVQTRISELRLLEKNLDYTTGLLESLALRDRSIPSIRLYEDISGFKKMLEEHLKSKNEVLVINYISLWADLIGADYLEDYFIRRSAKGVHTRLIFPPSDFGTRVNRKSKEYKIQIRVLPEDMKWRSAVVCWDDNLAISSLTEGKLTCTIIENKDIAHFFRTILFELCWKQAKPIA